MRSILLVLLFVVFGSIPGLAEPAPAVTAEDPAVQAALTSYLESASTNKAWLRDVSMDVDIDAALPKLKKTGRLHALRHISELGKITYRILTFQGDNTVKKDVIARYLEAEAKSTDSSSIAINHANYKFKYRGTFGDPDWQLYLFELEPKSKRVGLFQGWLWIHAATGLPVREQGEFVKSPSIFLKKISFVRDFELRDGIAVPKRLDTVSVTRGFGTAELSIRFSNYSKQEVGKLASFSARAGDSQ